ncbi:hypothetical protein JCM19000A_42930 [Silvimonas sp. JCM 19000]
MNKPERLASAATARMFYAVAIDNAWKVIMATQSDTANQPGASATVAFVPDDDPTSLLPVFVTRTTLRALLGAIPLAGWPLRRRARTNFSG